MSKDSTRKEVEMRGTALKLSVTIEGVLMNIVYSSSDELYMDKSKSYLLKLKECMFGQKIQRAKEVLEMYHPDLLIKNEKLFIDINIFKDFRNRMAHCGFSWAESLSEFEVWDVTEDETKFQFYAPIKYTVVDVNLTMLKAIKSIIPPLTQLLNEVENRLQKSNQKIYDLLKLREHTSD